MRYSLLAIALLAGVNLAVAAVATWANSPFTLIPIFYFEYRLGAFLLGLPPQSWPGSVSWEWVDAQLVTIWKPLFLGAFIVGCAASAAVFFVADGIWRWSSTRRLRRRRELTKRSAGATGER